MQSGSLLVNKHEYRRTSYTRRKKKLRLELPVSRFNNSLVIELISLRMDTRIETAHIPEVGDHPVKMRGVSDGSF